MGPKPLHFQQAPRECFGLSSKDGLVNRPDRLCIRGSSCEWWPMLGLGSKWLNPGTYPASDSEAEG